MTNVEFCLLDQWEFLIYQIVSCCSDIVYK